MLLKAGKKPTYATREREIFGTIVPVVPCNLHLVLMRKSVNIKLVVSGCGDICNGETVFTRDTSLLTPAQKNDLATWFKLPKSNADIVQNDSPPDSSRSTKINPAPVIHKDTLATKLVTKVVNTPKKDTTANCRK